MLSTWAKKRRIVYGAIVITILILLIIPVVVKLTQKTPTCFDGKQNQGETAPDRGGPCRLRDPRLLQPVKVLWARSFPVRHDTAAAVAYVENANPHSGIEMISYQFRLYTDDNFLVAERFGRTPILPGMITPVIEPNIDTGKHTVTRTFFQFVEEPTWVRMDNPTIGLEIQNIKLERATSTPRISAEVTNANVLPKKKVVLTIVVFDTVGNAIAASRTFLKRIEGNTTIPVVFTWPHAFRTKVGRIDIIPLLAPQTSP